LPVIVVEYGVGSVFFKAIGGEEVGIRRGDAVPGQIPSRLVPCGFLREVFDAIRIVD
jgi:hypothetical protein